MDQGFQHRGFRSLSAALETAPAAAVEDRLDSREEAGAGSAATRQTGLNPGVSQLRGSTCSARSSRAGSARWRKLLARWIAGRPCRTAKKRCASSADEDWPDKPTDRPPPGPLFSISLCGRFRWNWQKSRWPPFHRQLETGGWLAGRLLLEPSHGRAQSSAAGAAGIRQRGGYDQLRRHLPRFSCSDRGVASMRSSPLGSYRMAHLAPPRRNWRPTRLSRRRRWSCG